MAKWYSSSFCKKNFENVKLSWDVFEKYTLVVVRSLYFWSERESRGKFARKVEFVHNQNFFCWTKFGWVITPKTRLQLCKWCNHGMFIVIESFHVNAYTIYNRYHVQNNINSSTHLKSLRISKQLNSYQSHNHIYL